MSRRKNKYIFAPDKRYREYGHRVRNTVLVVLALVVVLFFVANFIISHQVKLVSMKLTVLNLPEDLEGYSILHLSDLHGAELGQQQAAIAAALGQTRYSCVVMTGDMLGEDGDLDPLLDLLALMPGDTPKYYIPGDTDGDWLDTFAHGSLSVFTDWAVRLQEAGVILLDRPMSETRGKGTIWFVPESLYTLNLDSMEQVYTSQMKDLDLRATSLDADGAAWRRVLEYELQRIQELREIREEVQAQDMQVVLSHVPLTEDYIQETFSVSGKEDYFSMRYAGLILAGHYNGGQWRIPFLGPLYVPELGWLPKASEVSGLSYPAGIPQYVSPGLGSDPHYTYQPGRLFNPPTITLITLTRRAV